LPIGSRDYRKTLFVACHAGKFREISTPQNAILLPLGKSDYRKTLFVACHAGKFREISTPQNAILLPLGKSKLLSTRCGVLELGRTNLARRQPFQIVALIRSFVHFPTREWEASDK
jgi:hypothetical protein